MMRVLVLLLMYQETAARNNSSRVNIAVPTVRHGWCLPGQHCKDGDCCALGSSCNTCPHGATVHHGECRGKGDMMCRIPGQGGQGQCLPGATCQDGDCCAAGSSCNTCPHGSQSNNDVCALKGNMICCMAPGCSGPGWCLPGQKCKEFDCCAAGSSCNTCPYGYAANNDECAGKGNMICLGANGSGDPHPLASDEAYLAPYLDELLDYRDNPIARRYIFLSDLVNVLPTWLIDIVLKIILHGNSVTVPIHKEIPVDLPGSKRPFATFTLESIELKDITTLSNLWVPHLMSSGKFTWAASFDLPKFGVALNTKIKVLGKDTDLIVDLDLKGLHFDMQTIIAFNRTRLCEIYSGVPSLISSRCGAWALGIDAERLVSGLNITKLHVGLEDVNFSIAGGGNLTAAIEKEILKMLDRKKGWFIANMPTKISEFLRLGIDVAGIAKLASMKDATDCLPRTGTISNETLNASRICISNNGAFAESFSAANCQMPAGRGVSKPSSTFPIDQSRCLDVETVLPGTKEGDIIRTVGHATAGIYEILDPPLRYAPNSNSASFECSGSTLQYKCPLVSIAPINKSHGAPGRRICIINHAGFVMSFDLLKNGHSIGSTHNYPIEQMQCLDLQGKAAIGDLVTAEVHACGGRVNKVDQPVTYSDNDLVVTYECTGTTLDYHCKVLGSYESVAFNSAFAGKYNISLASPEVLCSSPNAVSIMV